MNRVVLAIIAFSVSMGLIIGCHLQAFNGLCHLCSLVCLSLEHQVFRTLNGAGACADWAVDVIFARRLTQIVRNFETASRSQPEAACDAYFPSTMPYTSRQIFGSDLQFAREEPLVRSRDKFVFRVLYLPFYEQPICLRLELASDGNPVLFAKESSGRTRFGPDQTVVERKVQLSAEDYKAFCRQFEQAKYFQKPIEAISEKPYVTFGGTSWLFEANEFGKYHFLVRNSDTFDDGNMREIAVMLLRRATIFRDVH